MEYVATALCLFAIGAISLNLSLRLSGKEYGPALIVGSLLFALTNISVGTLVLATYVGGTN